MSQDAELYKLCYSYGLQTQHSDEEVLEVEPCFAMRSQRKLSIKSLISEKNRNSIVQYSRASTKQVYN